VVFSLASPDDISRLKRERKSKLSLMGNTHPLLDLPRRVEQVGISILNGGILFDLEFPIAWKMLTGKQFSQDQLWMYFYPLS
jgi:hypothetical protein